MGSGNVGSRSRSGLDRSPWRASPLGAVELSSCSDEDLLELVAKRRDEAAFDELYRRYGRAVYGVVRRLIGEHSGTEDVVQRAFTNVWRSAAGYRRERGPATGWLFAIARNAAVEALGSRVAPRRWGVSDWPDEWPGPDGRASDAEHTFRIHTAVDRLPDEERQVIELAYFDDLSPTEVAARLEAPLGTIKTRTCSALAHLADVLGA